MVGFQGIERVLGRLCLAALLVLIASVLWIAKPWAPTIVAIRPDTGTQAAELSGDALEGVLIELLKRVYAAFGETEEGAIYDGLATAVASDLLTDLYLQRRAIQATQPPDPEGGAAKIVDLTLDEYALLPDQVADGYRISAVWTVTGIIGHEDHRHERINTYAANLTLGPSDREWRLTAFDLDQVRREDPEPLFFEEFQ